MRLNGGEFLLNLLVLGALTISSESVTITDESVIEQLTGLKNYIKNEKAIKPLFVKFDNGTEIVVAKGEIKKTKGGLSFELGCVTKSNSLTINVTFTQMVNANDDPINDYYIADGDVKYSFTDNNNLVVETIKQTKPNFELDISNLEFFTIPEGLEQDIKYGRIEEINGVLYIVLAFTFTNTTESAITLPNFNVNITLPTEIAEKIIDFSGKSVHDTTSTAPISADVGLKGSTTYPDAMNVVFSVSLGNLIQENVLRLNLFGATTNIPAGQEIYFSFRTFLTIL